MDRADLPREYPAYMPIDLGATSDPLQTLMRSRELVVHFLADAHRRNYLQVPGVRLILPAHVEPETHELFTGTPALLVGPLDPTLEATLAEMTRVTRGNRQRGASYYHQVLREFTGSRGSVLVFTSRRVEESTWQLPIHVAKVEYEDRGPIALTSMPHFWEEAKLTAVGRDDHLWQVYLQHVHASGPPERLPIAPPVRIHPTTAEDSELFQRFIDKTIGADTEYLEQISLLAQLATIIIAVPRPFHVTGDDAVAALSRLGASGLTFLFDRSVPVTEELISRCFLLTDRVVSLFDRVANTYQSGQRRAYANAFDIIDHSLKNTLTHAAGRDAAAINDALEIERVTLEAAKALVSDRRWATQLLPWQRELGGCKRPFETVVLGSFGESAERLRIAAEPLHHRHVDPRFMGAVVELARNIGHYSRRGSIDVTVDADHRVTLRSRNACTLANAQGLRNALSQRELQIHRGLTLTFSLLERLVDDRSTARLWVTAPNDDLMALIRQAEHCFPGGLVVPLLFGAQVLEDEAAPEDERSTHSYLTCELEFTSLRALGDDTDASPLHRQ